MTHLDQIESLVESLIQKKRLESFIEYECVIRVNWISNVESNIKIETRRIESRMKSEIPKHFESNHESNA